MESEYSIEADINHDLDSPYQRNRNKIIADPEDEEQLRIRDMKE